MKLAHVWKDNIERVKALYQSDYYHYLQDRWPAYIRSICEKLIEDPDACDKGLYLDKANDLSSMSLQCKGVSCSDGDIVLGMDCIIGWKRIFDIHSGKIEWIDDYNQIRSKLSAHLLWPRNGNNTINTVRARVFNDRIDYTLYDIKMFYNYKRATNHCRMKSAFDNAVTLQWFSKFRSFEELAESMHLTCFLDDDYNVINISDTTSIIQDYGDDVRVVDSVYLQNLKQILKDCI